jgi:hypothetical protein
MLTSLEVNVLRRVRELGKLRKLVVVAWGGHGLEPLGTPS